MYGLIALLVIALGIGGFFGGRALGLWDSSPKTLTMPADLINKSFVADKQELQQLGFTNVASRAQASSQVQDGNVISTDPTAGTKLKSNAPVVLVVSSGPVQVAVPDVTGKPSAQATQLLQSAGFFPNVTQANSNTVPQGTVISTSPAGGQKAAQGSAVQVVVSAGKQRVTIPPLVDLDPATAGQQLGAEQLVVTEVPEASLTVPAGEVTRTNPPAGASVPVGSTVTVYVSTGPPQTAVPVLGGDTMAQAQAALRAVGLQPSFTTEIVTDRTQDGKVQSQNPVANSMVAQGSTVNVVIGSFRPATTTTTASTTTTSTTTTVGATPPGT
jgi:serine/threonine-protein kinase